jgi:hypothetical protein
MKKDLSKVIEKYVYSHLYHRDDILVQVSRTPKRYNVHIIVYLKPTDGLWATIHKGVDRQDLMRGLKDYLNLDWDSCMIFCQLKDN